jgi:hypothetical protein
VQAFADEFEDWKQQQPARQVAILLYGVTEKADAGFVLLEVKQPLPEEVYMQFIMDDDVHDYVLCHLVPSTTTTPTS